MESYRLGQFPVEVREFWQTHYVRHSGAHFVAGVQIAGGAVPQTAEVIVPGEYRWIPARPDSNSSLHVGEGIVHPGETVMLKAGWYRVESDPAGATGKLVLAALPAPDGDYFDF